jgi:hypothetical protein
MELIWFSNIKYSDIDIYFANIASKIVKCSNDLKVLYWFRHRCLGLCSYNVITDEQILLNTS